MFKKRTFKTIISVICIVLVSVILCGVVSRCTDGFTDFESRELNEDNLLYGLYEDPVFYGPNLSFDYIDGVLNFSGETENDQVVLSLCYFDLEPGVYTYTCFSGFLSNPSNYTYYSYVYYCDSSGIDHYIFADVDWDEFDLDGYDYDDCSAGYSTFVLEEEVSVIFYIAFAPQKTFNSVKAMPCLVKGDEPGSFYK